jgi:hypothetical protein
MPIGMQDRGREMGTLQEAIANNPPVNPEEVWAILERIAKRQEEYDRRMGHTDNLFGEITEYMVAPRLCDKFTELGFDFLKTNRSVRINDKVNKIYLEIDIMLENGDKAMLIEIKTKLTAERVEKHIERLAKMREYADLRGDKRSFLGAMAGIVTTDEVKNYILGQGLYLIEPSGDNINITSPSGNPREW